MTNDIQEKIKKIMSIVLDVSINKINSNSSPDTIESWDSLKHMNLIISLEEEFNITFTDEEIFESMNYKLIETIITEKR